MGGPTRPPACHLPATRRQQRNGRTGRSGRRCCGLAAVRPERRPPPPTVPRNMAGARPGPDQLGRHAVVAAGGAAPAPWDHSAVVTITAAVVGVPAEACNGLRRATAAGERAADRNTRGRRVHRAPRHARVDDRPAVRTRASSRSSSTNSTTSSGRTRSTSAIPSVPVLAGSTEALAAGATPSLPVHRVTSSSPTAPPCGSTAGRSATAIRSTACPSLHRVAVEHGSLAFRSSNERRTPTSPPTSSRRSPTPAAPARIIAPAGSGKTRVLTERARHLLGSWRVPARPRSAWSRSTSGPRRRCASAPPTCRGLARAHAELARARRSSTARRRSRRSRGAGARSTSATCAACIGELVSFARAAQHRPGGAVDRGAERWSGSACAHPSEVEAALRRRRRRASPTCLAALPRRACDRARRRRLRRADLPGHRGAARRAEARRGRRSARAGCCSSTSSRTSRRPTCCSSGCWPRPTAPCSASATTTRRSTATTAPTRPG